SFPTRRSSDLSRSFRFPLLIPYLAFRFFELIAYPLTYFQFLLMLLLPYQKLPRLLTVYFSLLQLSLVVPFVLLHQHQLLAPPCLLLHMQLILILIVQLRILLTIFSYHFFLSLYELLINVRQSWQTVSF